MHKCTSGSSIIVVSWLVGSSWSRIHKSSKWEQSIPVFQKTKNAHWSCLSSSLSPVCTKHCASNTHERTLGKTPRNTHSFINSNRKNDNKQKHGTKTITQTKKRRRFQKPKSHRLTWSTWSWSFATFAEAWKRWTRMVSQHIWKIWLHLWI